MLGRGCPETFFCDAGGLFGPNAEGELPNVVMRRSLHDLQLGPISSSSRIILTPLLVSYSIGSQH